MLSLFEGRRLAMKFGTLPSDDGIAVGEATECLSANAAVMRAEALSRQPGHVGAIAFSRTGDPSSGEGAVDAHQDKPK